MGIPGLKQCNFCSRFILPFEPVVKEDDHTYCESCSIVENKALADDDDEFTTEKFGDG